MTAKPDILNREERFYCKESLETAEIEAGSLNTCIEKNTREHQTEKHQFCLLFFFLINAVNGSEVYGRFMKKYKRLLSSK